MFDEIGFFVHTTTKKDSNEKKAHLIAVFNENQIPYKFLKKIKEEIETTVKTSEQKSYHRYPTQNYLWIPVNFLEYHLIDEIDSYRICGFNFDLSSSWFNAERMKWFTQSEYNEKYPYFYFEYPTLTDTLISLGLKLIQSLGFSLENLANNQTDTCIFCRRKIIDSEFEHLYCQECSLDLHLPQELTYEVLNNEIGELIEIEKPKNIQESEDMKEDKELDELIVIKPKPKEKKLRKKREKMDIEDFIPEHTTLFDFVDD